MAENQKKQEKQAAAEEHDEIVEATEAEAAKTEETEAETEVTSPAEDSPVDSEAAADRATTKAGKRSAKAQREAETEAARKQAAAEHAQAEPAPKPKKIQARNPLKIHGKAYRAAQELVEKTRLYELTEAISLAKQTAKTSFDSSVELHINLGVDPRQADQMVRSTVVLPAGTGKKVRVAVLAGVDKLEDAKKAGADITSDGDLIATIEKGKLEFDVLVASPDMMPKLSKVAKVLGPRGLMPNPKSGTVTPNVAAAVEQAKAGRVEFRIDKQAIVHLVIGKASFTADKLESNAKAAIDAILKAKPSAAKGTYVKAVSLATSMGPGIKLDVQKAIAAANPKR